MSQEAQEVGIFPSTILLAIDGSEEAELATRRAVDLADTTGSELHVVYVGQLPGFLTRDPDIMGFYRMGVDRMFYEEIEQESLEILWMLTWQVKLSGDRGWGPPQGGQCARGDRGVGQGSGSGSHRHGNSGPR